MATITKRDLVERIAAKTALKRAVVKRTVQQFLDQITLELKRGNRLEFRDFGVFEIKERKARVGHNPKTLKRVEVPARKIVKFKSGRLLRNGIDEDTVREVVVKKARPAAENVR